MILPVQNGDFQNQRRTWWVHLFWGHLFPEKVKKRTKNAQFLEEYALLAQANFGVEMAFWDLFLVPDGLFSKLNPAEKIQNFQKFVDEPWHIPKSLLARMMQYLYRSSSRCTKLISVAKTLQNTFIDAKLVVDLKCKAKFKNLKKVVISTFGAKNAQNQVFGGWKKSRNFSFRNAWHGVVRTNSSKSWFWYYSRQTAGSSVGTRRCSNGVKMLKVNRWKELVKIHAIVLSRLFWS